MGKKLRHYLLPALLIAFVFNLLVIPLAHADVNYSQSNGSFHFTFNSMDDLGACSGASSWLIVLGYGGGTQAQGDVHSSSSHSVTDDFDIPDGSAIESIAVWGGASSDEAHAGVCTFGVDNNGFNWDAGGGSGPTISNISVSNVTSSSVKISWSTDQSAGTTVQYGKTSSYGSTATGSSGSSHSVTLTGLSASSTYHYKVVSDSASSGDNTFATPSSGSSGSSSSGSSSSTSTTTTTSVTATPTPTPAPDRSGPSVSITTDLSKPFIKPPQILGKAADPSGISKVEYSVDDGNNWNPVDAIPNSGATSITFSFTPPTLQDDNYNIRVRATDDSLSRNTGTSAAVTLIIDRLPPAIGGNIISIGPQILSPVGGYLLSTKGLTQKVTLSAVGGPTKIELHAYHPKTPDVVKTYTLKRNPDNGLWSGTLTFDEAGIYQLEGQATDGANNQTSRLLNKIAVLEAGKVIDPEKEPIKNAVIKLYYFEEKYQVWRLWDGPSYEQKNPAHSTDQGEFSYLVPSGKYYFDISANGFSHTISEIFVTSGPTLLNPSFSLKPLKLLFDLGFFKFYLPDFATTTSPVNFALSDLPTNRDGLEEHDAPQITLPTSDDSTFNLETTRGTAVILSFMNLWSPATTEQISSLDKFTSPNAKVYAVMLGDSRAKIAAMKKSAGYQTTFIVDTDGTLVEPYKVTTLPTHYFINRRGVIKNVVTGVLSETELAAKIAEIQ